MCDGSVLSSSTREYFYLFFVCGRIWPACLTVHVLTQRHIPAYLNKPINKRHLSLSRMLGPFYLRIIHFFHPFSVWFSLPSQTCLLSKRPSSLGGQQSLLPLCILKRLHQLASLLMMSVYFRVSCSPNISPAGRLTRSLALRHCFKRGPLCTCIEFKWETQPWSAGLKKQHLLF